MIWFLYGVYAGTVVTWLVILLDGYVFEGKTRGNHYQDDDGNPMGGA